MKALMTSGSGGLYSPKYDVGLDIASKMDLNFGSPHILY